MKAQPDQKRRRVSTTARLQPRGASEPGYSTIGSREGEPHRGEPGARLYFRRFSDIERECFARRAREPVPPPGRQGPVPRPRREIDEAADAYANMRTCPPTAPEPWKHYRVSRLGPLWQNLADGSPLPEDAVFVADCPAPMSHDDAVRNVTRLFGVESRKYALDLLYKADAERGRLGRERLPLPARRKRRARA